MRKLLFLLPIFIAGNLYADTVTDGPMQLLLPTTGFRDPERSVADKINANFTISAATVNKILGNIDGIASSTESLNAKIDAHNVFTSTTGEIIEAFHVQNSTSDDLIYKTLNFGTTTNDLITTALNQGATIPHAFSVPVMWQEEGSDVSTASVVNVVGGDATVTNDGSTITLTFASSGGGADTDSVARITVGTSSVQNVDIITTNHDGFNAAVSSINALNGLGGTIYVREGNYEWDETVVVSSTVEMIFDKGAVITIQQGDSSIENILNTKGRVSGGQWIPQNLATASTGMIVVDGPAAVFENFVIKDAVNATNAQHYMILLEGQGSVVRNFLMTNCVMTGGSPRNIGILTQTGGGNIIENGVFTMNSGAGGAKIVISSTNSSIVRGNTFTDNTWTGFAVIFMDKSSACLITNNFVDLTRTSAVTGVYAQTTGGTTFVYMMNISNNTFISGTNLILFDSFNTTGFAVNCKVSDNLFRNPNTAAIKLQRSASGTNVNNFFHGNVVNTGTMFSEDASSINTLKADNVTGDTLAN